MATQHFTQPATISEPHFNAYKWAPPALDDINVTIPGSNFADLCSDAKETADGIAVILEMVEQSQLDRSEDNQRPLLSGFAEGVLLRLAIRSATSLSSRCDDVMSWAYKYRTAEGRAAAKAT